MPAFLILLPLIPMNHQSLVPLPLPALAGGGPSERLHCSKVYSPCASSPDHLLGAHGLIALFLNSLRKRRGKYIPLDSTLSPVSFGPFLVTMSELACHALRSNELDWTSGSVSSPWCTTKPQLTLLFTCPLPPFQLSVYPSLV